MTDKQKRAMIALVSDNCIETESEVRTHRVPRRRMASAEAAGRGSAPKGRANEAADPVLGRGPDRFVTVIGAKKSPAER